MPGKGFLRSRRLQALRRVGRVSDACRTGAANDWRLEAETRPDDAAKAAEELPFWKRHSLFADSVSDEPYDKA